MLLLGKSWTMFSCERLVLMMTSTSMSAIRLKALQTVGFSSLADSPVSADSLIAIASGKNINALSNNQDFRPVASSESHHHSLVLRDPNQPINPKILRVSVLGMPNAGKSTFINSVLGKKVLATSEKVDTTTENINAVTTIDDTQILFQDTPGIVGIHKAKRLGIPSVRHKQPAASFGSADVGIILADLTSQRIKNGYLQPEILLTMLKNKHVPSVLVLNKVDKYKKKNHLPVLIHLLTAGQIAGVPFSPEKISIAPMRLPKVEKFIPENYDELDLADVDDLERRLAKNQSSLLNKLRHYRGWPHFQDVFIISAKERLGLDVLRNYMMLHARPGPWQYHDEVVTDASPKQIILDSVRASLLENLPDEIPYQVLPDINEWQELDDGRLYLVIDVLCRKRSHFNCVMRKSGRVAKDSQEHLQDVFFREVFVQISPTFVKNFRI